MAGTSPSMALTKRSSDTLLMPPPPAPKRIKRPTQVLDEEEYTEALSHIIARDFFPGLLQAEVQQEYLDALESNDRGWIVSAGQRLKQSMTPGPDGRRLRGKRGTSLATPAYAGSLDESPVQPERASMSEAAIQERLAASGRSTNTNMSLGAFQQRYTSEDNESFYKLLDKQNQKRREKYAWMWEGNKIPAARQIAHRKRERLLANKGSQEMAENGKELMKLENGDKRPAMPQTWSGGPRNTFMFAPESIEDDYQTVAQRNEETSLAPPKSVAYDNTRMDTSAKGNLHRPSSPTLSAVKDAIAGRPRLTASEASASGAATPRVNGYSFVDSEEPEQPSVSLPLTDPLLSVDPGDSSNPFKLKESSSREALHHRMVDKILKGKRSNTGNSRASTLKVQDTPKFLSSPRVERKGGLTPAAARLLGKVGTPVMDKSRSGMWDTKDKTPRVSGLRAVATPKRTG